MDSGCPCDLDRVKAKKAEIMTRNGKIARLPRAIRDELNRRLDNGEPGAQLVNWLNTSPEVREVLRRDFDGRPVNEVNLTDWRTGGFLDWQAQSEASALIEQLKSNNEEFAGLHPGELADSLTTAIVAQYAAAVYRSNIGTAEEPSARVRRLGKSLRDLDRLRRREQARERIEIQREWLEFERRKYKERHQTNSESVEELENSNVIQPMTEEEKTELLKELLLPKDEDNSSPQNGGQLS
jgi:hypothetical protein